MKSTVLNSLGRRTRRVDSASMTNDFGYNGRSELISAAMGTNAFAYQYDPIGNRLTSSSDVGGALRAATYAANSLNQYVEISDMVSGTVAPSYDADGNLTNNASFAFSWDAENRLVGASSESTLASYAYDYQGRRHQKVVGSATNTFLYDGWNLVSEICNTESEITTNFYVWGADLSGTLQGAGGIGGLLSVTRITSSGTAIYFPCYDANGNISDYVDASGTVVAHREYDAYGNTVVATGPMVNDFNFWFSTKYLDQETGFYYYGFRYYDPVTGRWLSRDPMGEAAFVALNNEMANEIRRERLKDHDLLNGSAPADQIGVADAYLFVGNSPISSFDYLGLSWFSCWANCIDKWKWDWGAILGIALTPGTPIGKTKIERLWKSAGVSERTTWLSRAVGKGNQLLIKLPLGSPVRTKMIGAMKNIRWAARNPVVVGASSAASLLVVLEGFYDIGIEIRCGIECCF